ncbi:hypothetical protein SE17_41845, partial [Kouleothrix aurantiaca]
ITVAYRVAEEQQEAFFQAMAAVEIIRRRDGATRWGLFRDAADLERVLETFVVASWDEHMRQHERATVADRAEEERALDLTVPDSTTEVSHFIAARAILRHSAPAEAGNPSRSGQESVLHGRAEK